MNEKEIWLPVVGYTGFYEVSNMGEVKSLYAWRGSNCRVLKPGLNSHGYKTVVLCSGVSKKSKTVHTIVAEAFLEIPQNGMEVCHNDGDKLNCKLSNLRYDTKINNQKDRTKHGTSNRGEKCGTSKLKEADILEIKKMLNGKLSQKEIGKIYGVGFGTISKIKRKVRWAHI